MIAHSQRPDICVGTDPFHTPLGLTFAVARAANDLGLTVDINRPFAGALLPAKHYRTDARVKSLMIEVNRRIYMNEVTGERLISFESVKHAVGKLLAGED
jgi:N-formylglutamate deformylase